MHSYICTGRHTHTHKIKQIDLKSYLTSGMHCVSSHLSACIRLMQYWACHVELVSCSWSPGSGALAACAPDLMVTGSCSSLLPTASQHIVTRYIATLRNDVHDIEPTTFTSSSVIYSQYFDQIHLCTDGNHLWTGASPGWEQHWSLRLNRNIQKAVWQHVPLGKTQ